MLYYKNLQANYNRTNILLLDEAGQTAPKNPLFARLLAQQLNGELINSFQVTFGTPALLPGNHL